jgi:poly(A) polymerase
MIPKQFATSIIATLRDRGHRAFLCGGCVRDLLLAREPADYDVTTDATPEQVMRIFPETYAVGAQFGGCACAASQGFGCRSACIGESDEGQILRD